MASLHYIYTRDYSMVVQGTTRGHCKLYCFASYNGCWFNITKVPITNYNKCLSKGKHNVYHCNLIAS